MADSQLGQWIFQELGGASVRRDPNEAELFKTEQADEGEYAGTDALVREVLQNSLDAAKDGAPVHVRLALHAAHEGPSPERMGHYFRRLQKPLSLRNIEFGVCGNPLLPGGFLVCEDFGTRGLGGDPLRARDPAVGDRTCNDFFWFWRNIGRSGKTGVDLGRWGLGKTVYRAASRTGCMLGLTVRSADQRHLLMGQAVLKIHEVDGIEYVPEGYWCGGCNENGLPIPIDDAATLEEFRREWKLTRTNEPGLSVVVPYVAPELQPSRILQAVAVHFFARILRGQLSVTVAGPTFGEVTLDAGGIQAACNRVLWDGPKRTKRHVAPPIAFAKAALLSPRIIHDTAVIATDGPPSLDNAFDSATLQKLRREFTAGEMLTVRVKIRLQRRDGLDCEGEIDVHLQRHADGQRRDSYFIREGMTITKINSSAALRGIQAFVNVDGGPLASLLGDAEGPAHEDWDTSEERPDRTWKNWKYRVRFVRKIVDELVELLNPPSDEPDFDLLSDFFSIEKVQSPLRPRPSIGTKDEVGERLAQLEPSTYWYRVTERSGGFTISPSKAFPPPSGAILRIAVAYDLPSGNPLKNWSRFVFEFNGVGTPLKCTGKHVAARVFQGNIIDLTVNSPEFVFSVEGFDRNRDLFIRVDEITEAEIDESKSSPLREVTA